MSYICELLYEELRKEFSKPYFFTCISLHRILCGYKDDYFCTIDLTEHTLVLWAPNVNGTKKYSIYSPTCFESLCSDIRNLGTENA